MYQPWRTFAAIINKCLSRKITGLDKLRLSKAQILWRMKKRTLVTVEEEEHEPAKKVVPSKKPAAKR
ncbi:hypothetical protein Tco_0862136 [Tanacetum coccineum]